MKHQRTASLKEMARLLLTMILLGPVYMSQASPDTRAGPLRRDDFQPGFI